MHSHVPQKVRHETRSRKMPFWLGSSKPLARIAIAFKLCAWRWAVYYQSLGEHMAYLYHGYVGQHWMLKTSVRIYIYIVSHVYLAQEYIKFAHTREHTHSLLFPRFHVLSSCISPLSLGEKCIMEDDLNNYRKLQLHYRIMKWRTVWRKLNGAGFHTLTRYHAKADTCNDEFKMNLSQEASVFFCKNNNG